MACRDGCNSISVRTLRVLCVLRVCVLSVLRVCACALCYVQVVSRYM